MMDQRKPIRRQTFISARRTKGSALERRQNGDEKLR
jgi:hypothetical protein